MVVLCNPEVVVAATGIFDVADSERAAVRVVEIALQDLGVVCAASVVIGIVTDEVVASGARAVGCDIHQSVAMQKRKAGSRCTVK